jgi:hypothetical protein
MKDVPSKKENPEMISIPPNYPNASQQSWSFEENMNYNIMQLATAKASYKQHADITVVTAEGDRITLSSNSQHSVDFATYDGLVRTNGAATRLQWRELSLSSGNELSLTVEGDLSAEELKDLEKALKSIEKMVRDFIAGDMNHAMTTGLNPEDRGSLSSLEASLSFERVVFLEKSFTGNTAPSIPDFGMDKVLANGPITRERIDEVKGQMANVLTNTAIKASKIYSPLEQFLTHLFKKLSKEKAFNSRGLALMEAIKSDLLDEVELLSEKSEDERTMQVAQ